MDLDRGLVSRLLDEGEPAYAALSEMGIDPTWLYGDWSRTLRFVLEHRQNHGALPSKAAVEMRMGVQFGAQEADSASFFIVEVRQRRLFNLLKEGAENFIATLAKAPKDPTAALAALEATIQRTRQEKLGVSKIVSIFDLIPAVIERYERMERGEHGILLPWQPLNRMTTGLWPEDVTVFVARTGIGKTQALVVCAADAFRQGKKVLFVSTEMAGVRIAARYFAFDCKVPYQDLRSGTLSAFAKPLFMGEIQKRAGATGFWLVGGGFDVDLRSIEAAIQECKPDIVYVDGLYLVQGRGDDRYEAASNAVHDIKRLAKRLQLPFVLSTQFNRSVKQNATAGSLESISLSDVVAWDSDWVFGLFQDDDMRANRRMKIDTLKAREGDPVEIESNWNWDAQDFSEAVGQSGSTPHDPDFDNVPV